MGNYMAVLQANGRCRMITLSGQDIWSLVGIIVGLTGIGIGIRQTLCARKSRKLYEEKCLTRIKDACEIIGNLINHATIACQEVKSKEFLRESESNINSIKHVIILTAKIDSIMTLTCQLVRFCERLNEEHQLEYGKLAVADLSSKLRRLVCFDFVPHDFEDFLLPDDSITNKPQ